MSSKSDFWDSLTPVLIVLFIIFLVGVIYMSTVGDDYDDNEFCPKLGVSKHTTVLIDKTDRYTIFLTNQIRDIIINIAQDLEKGELLSIYAIKAEELHGRHPVFRGCSPGSHKSVSILTGNPTYKKYQFELLFERKLNALLEELLIQEDYPRSPIMQDLNSLSDRKDFSNDLESRKVILISDMLQNTESFNAYEQSAEDMRARLTSDNTTLQDGISISIFVIPRANHRQTQKELLTQFWPKVMNGMNHNGYQFLN